MDEQVLSDILRSFAENRVDYAIFGAVALGLHGLARATEDLDVFLRPDPENVERLKRALLEVFDAPSIEEISADDLCGDYPAVRYYPPEGFGLDILTRLGGAFLFEDLEIETRDLRGIDVRVVSAHTSGE